MDTLKTIAVYLILALVCYILAYLLKSRKADLLKTITGLVQEAEKVVQGSGMGAEKKALVMIQLEAAGIKITAAVDSTIDSIVNLLNKNSGWLIDKTTDTASSLEVKIE